MIAAAQARAPDGGRRDGLSRAKAVIASEPGDPGPLPQRRYNFCIATSPAKLLHKPINSVDNNIGPLRLVAVLTPSGSNLTLGYVRAYDGGDDFVWIGGPGEGLRFLIVLFEEAVDRGLQVGDRSKDAAL